MCRKEQKTDGDENEENLPVGKIELLEPADDVIGFAVAAFVDSVSAKEEEHRNANFSEDAKELEGRCVEYGENVGEWFTCKAVREKPKVVHEHADDGDALHDSGVVGGQIIVDLVFGHFESFLELVVEL